MTPAELYNLVYMRIRPLLVTVPGIVLPHPYGGQDMQVMVNLDQQKLLARHLTPADIHDVLMKQYLVLPAGDIKIKQTDWIVLTNASPLKIEHFGDIPIKREGNAFIYLRDVATVQLMGRVQQNAVLVKGKQTVIIVAMKSTEASTLDVVDGIKKMIPRAEQVSPEGVKIRLLDDASTFVKDSISDVLHEMLMAGALVGLIVLLLLGSWRATVIVWTSIPLSILTAIIGLHLLERDDQCHDLGRVGAGRRHSGRRCDRDDREYRSPYRNGQAARTGHHRRRQSDRRPDARRHPLHRDRLAPALRARRRRRLPVQAHGGGGHHRDARLLHPVAHAGADHGEIYDEGSPCRSRMNSTGSPARNRRGTPSSAFRRGSSAASISSASATVSCSNSRSPVAAPSSRFLWPSRWAPCPSFSSSGAIISPRSGRGSFTMHMRAPLGTRIEVSGRIATLVSNSIEELLPGEVENVVSNCGLPVGPHNLAFIPTPTIGSQDCDLTILLKDEKSPVWDYRRTLRKGLRERYPGTEFTFQPSDLTAKILNFGAPAPIDVQVNGPDVYPNYEFARKLVGKFREIPGAADVVIQQTMRTPTLMVEGNRTFGLGVNRTLKDMADNLLMTTAGSQQVDQIYWLDPSTGMSYLINVYTPQSQINSVNSLKTIPVDSSTNSSNESEMQLLGNLADISAEGTPGVVTHGNIMPLFNIYVSAEGRDLGGVLADVEKVTKSMEHELPRSAAIEIHGQASLMHDAYFELIFGLARRDRAGLSADRRQLPILAGSLHHHYGLARRAGGHRVGIVPDPYASVGARADGRHHDHGHGNRQFDPRRLLRPRTARRARRRAAGRDRSRERPASVRCS